MRLTGLEALNALAAAEASRVGGGMAGGFNFSGGPGGSSMSLPPAPPGAELFSIKGNLTAGGVYKLNPCYPNCRGGTSSATTIGTGTLCYVNTNQTFVGWNASEIGGSFHFVPTGSFVLAYSTAAADPLQTAAIRMFNSPIPQNVYCTLTSAGGLNGTYPAGGSATQATYLYNGVYLGQTLCQSATPARTFSGNTVKATHGICYQSPDGSNVWALGLTDESRPGDVCSS